MKLNNHPNYVWKPDAIPASRHFSGKNHNFNTDAKFITIEQIDHIDIGKEKNKERLKGKAKTKGKLLDINSRSTNSINQSRT